MTDCYCCFTIGADGGEDGGRDLYNNNSAARATERCRKEKERCTECRNSWSELCRSVFSCDFASGDGDSDNQRESGAFWCCLCWMISFCLLCPRALFKTCLACFYPFYRLCRDIFLNVILCGLCRRKVVCCADSFDRRRADSVLSYSSSVEAII